MSEEWKPTLEELDEMSLGYPPCNECGGMLDERGFCQHCMSYRLIFYRK